MSTSEENMLLPTDQQSLLASPVLSKEEWAITLWLQAKEQISQSAKTHKAYLDTIQDFRVYLQEHGSDLFDEQPQAIYRLVGAFFSFSKRGKAVTASTRRQRRAILSSFYTYCNRSTLYPHNPIALTEQVKGETEHDAAPIHEDDIELLMNAIDTRTVAGLRDYLLLRLALMTARRASEIARLTWGDMRLENRQTIITFLCKGKKKKKDALTPEMIGLFAHYRQRLTEELLTRQVSLTDQTPIFPSFSNRTYGAHLTIQALGQISLKYLKESRFHALRHSAAVALEKQHQPISAISEQLGHSNLKTTGDYLKQKRELLPVNGSILEKAFKFKPRIEV